MAAHKPFMGVFEGMDFPPYVYQHFPLMMKRDGSDDYVIVENEEEQEKAEADGFVAPKVGPPANVTVAEVEALNAEVAEKDSEIEELKKQIAEMRKPSAPAPKAPAPAQPAAALPASQK